MSLHANNVVTVLLGFWVPDKEGESISNIYRVWYHLTKTYYNSVTVYDQRWLAYVLSYPS